MTTRDDGHGHDVVTAFACEARSNAESVFGGRSPDFAAMLARAREIDPSAIGEDAVIQAGSLAPVIPIGRTHRGVVDELAPFEAAARAELATRVPRPAVDVPVPRRRLAAVAIGLAAVAAAVLLWQVPRMAARDARQHGGVEAVDRSDAPALLRTAPAPAELPGEQMRPVVVAPPVVEQEPVPAPVVSPVVSRPARKSADGPALEDEAQALWQRGELAAAERKLREVVRVAGKTGRAELAYGDLFALAGQMRGDDGQAALAREYLAAFPRGRFADDMRAGLCQRAAADEQATCWQDYLERHPAGAHRREAEAAPGGGAAP